MWKAIEEIGRALVKEGKPGYAVAVVAIAFAGIVTLAGIVSF